jgi:hypothetical protein
MNRKPIYSDTNLWNRLFDQKVAPQRLLGELNCKSANLALSGQIIYELAKTFVSAPQRAQELFRYLQQYVDGGIVCAHDNMELLHQEVSAMNTGAPALAFYGPLEFSALKVEVRKLAQGIFDEPAQLFITNRNQFAHRPRRSGRSGCS